MGMFRCGCFVGYGRGEGGDRAIGWEENEDGITYFSFQLLFRLWKGLHCWVVDSLSLVLGNIGIAAPEQISRIRNMQYEDQDLS